MTFEVNPVGVVRSTLKDLRDAPMQGSEGAPDAFVDIEPHVADCLHGIQRGDELILLSWLDRADRAVMKVHPRDNPATPLTGVFATRSQDRPNPIGVHRVTVRAIDGRTLTVGPLEAIDGTPIVDIKPVLRDVADGFAAPPTAAAATTVAASAGPVRTSIAPWLSVRNCARAVEFYTAAFGATELYRLDGPDGSPIVAQLAVEGASAASFWIGEESSATADTTVPESVGGGSLRLILTVVDPHAAFARALAAGASEIFPVGEAHGWRLGRVVDPFGLHWEIGHRLDR